MNSQSLSWLQYELVLLTSSVPKEDNFIEKGIGYVGCFAPKDIGGPRGVFDLD